MLELRESFLESAPEPSGAESESGAALFDRLRHLFAGLRAKLILPYVLLTLLLAMVGVFVITRLVTSTVRERFVNQLLEASRVAADGVVRQEQTHLEDLRLMAFTQGVPEAMATGDVDRLNELLWPLAANNDMDAVTVVDLNGVEMLTVAQQQSGEYIRSEGADFSQYGLVSQVLNSTQDDQGDKYAELLVTSLGPYLFSSAPVRASDGQLLGVLMAGTGLESLLSELKAQSLADVIILDRTGALIATSMVESEQGFAMVEINPGLINDVNPSITLDFELYGRDFKATYAPLMVRKTQMGILGVALPSNFIVTTMATSRNTFSAIFALATVATIIIGYVLAQSIAKPILKLRAVSQAVAAGDLNQHTGLHLGDEIGELASAFDVMTLKLRERTAEAARLYDETLQRNQELAEINARLQSTQAQLIQSEKLAAVGQLTAGIVHDVKNPLAVIKGLAEELSEEFGLDPTTRDQLKTIRDSASRASTIVSDLLKFARQSTPEMDRRDLRETIESAVRLTEYLARKSNVTVKIDLPPAPVLVQYDAQQIEQVLINLISNGIQAIRSSGTVRINLSEAGGAVAIAVQDTGIGIPEKNLQRIFDPFFTTKPEGEGTGLGLSVSFGIVSKHRGRIEVESKPGIGTTFTVLLPVDQQEQAEPQPDSVGAAA